MPGHLRPRPTVLVMVHAHPEATADDRTAPPAGGSTRQSALDGLRGLAMVLVVLSHGWAIAPYDAWMDRPWRQLIGSGNYAVTIFFVVGGYFLITSMLREADRDGRIDILREVLRRALRIAIPVYVLLGTVLAVAAMQSTPDYSPESTRRSLAAIATFTWNWFLQNAALVARPDLGHLWYVSVYMQVTIALVIFATVTLRRRRLAMALLATAIVAITAWRFNVAANETIYQGLLRTTTRGDGMLWGALAAYAIHDKVLPARWSRFGAPALGLGALAFTALITIPSTPPDYLRWLGLIASVAVVAMVVGLQWLSPTSLLARPLQWRPLARIGHNSLSIYIWHYPLFWFIGHHSDRWAWQLSAIVALIALTVIVALTRELVEQPVAGMIDRWALTSRRPDSAVPEGDADGPGARSSTEGGSGPAETWGADAATDLGDPVRGQPDDVPTPSRHERRRQRFTRSNTP